MNVIKKEVYSAGDEFNLTSDIIVHSEMKTIFNKDYLFVWFVKRIEDKEE